VNASTNGVIYSTISDITSISTSLSGIGDINLILTVSNGGNCIGCFRTELIKMRLIERIENFSMAASRYSDNRILSFKINGINFLIIVSSLIF
jgi:hypothetical protein